MKFALPWPDKRLSPNARTHWGTRSTVAKKARQWANDAAMAACKAGLRDVRIAYHDKTGIRLSVVAYPPDNRRRDWDNIIASLKASFDGIADALAVDDSKFELTFRMEPSEGKPGRIEVEL